MARACLPLLVLVSLASVGACRSSRAPAPAQDGGARLEDAGVAQVPRRCLEGWVSPGSGPRFRDVTQGWGLSDVRGGRIASGDLDGDGYPDLIVHVAATHNRADFTKPASQWPYRVLLNRARAEGGRGFVDATIASGYGTLREPRPGVGRSAQFAVFADVDGDGDLDVFSGTYSDPTRPDTDPGDRSELLLNDGAASFTLAAVQPPVAGGATGRAMPTAAAAFVDQDRDGHLDLFVGHWYAEYGRSFLGAQDRLLRGRGDGTFADVTADLGLAMPGSRLDRGEAPRPTYGVTACDLDLDGNVELLASVYGRQWNHLWLQRGGAFTDVGRASGFAGDDLVDYSDNEYYRCYCRRTGTCTAPAPRIQCSGLEWAPGIDDQLWRLNGNTFTTACGDIDNDGDQDLLNAEIAHWHIGASSDRSGLLLNNGSSDGGVPILRRPNRETTGLQVPHVGTDWNEGGIGAAFADLDNDGRLDLLLALSDYPDQYLRIYWQQPDGSFRDVTDTAGVRHPCAPSFTLSDLDRDGDLDLVVTSSTMRSWCATKWRDGPEVRVYENVGGQDANWIQVHLEGSGAARGGANRSAVGAIVQVTAAGVTQTREIQGGYGHFGMQHDRDVTFGMGARCDIDALTIRWPDRAGTIEPYTDVRANYRMTARQGGGLEYRLDP